MPFSLRMVDELLVVELSDPLSAADLQQGADDVRQLESTLDSNPVRGRGYLAGRAGLRADVPDAHGHTIFFTEVIRQLRGGGTVG